MTHTDTWRSDRTVTKKIGMITKVNFDKLNVMCDLHTNWGNYDYRCNLEVIALIDGHERQLVFRSDALKGVFEGNGGNGYYHQWVFSRSVANAPQPLDESWVQDYKGAFDFIAKKRSYEKLKDADVVATIDKWK